MFVNHATGAVAPPAAQPVQVGDATGQQAKRRGLVQGTVRPVRVVEVLVLTGTDPAEPVPGAATVCAKITGTGGRLKPPSK